MYWLKIIYDQMYASAKILDLTIVLFKIILNSWRFLSVTASTAFCGGLIQIVDSTCLCSSFISCYIFGTVGFVNVEY